MSLIIRGLDLTAPRRVKESDLRRNSDGTYQAAIIWAIDTATFLGGLDTWPVRGVTAHPDFPDLKADVWTTRTPLQGVTLVNLSYVGAVNVDESITPGDALPLDVEEESAVVVSEEPIASAANFLKTTSVDGVTIDAITQPENGAWPAVDDNPITVDPTTGRFPLGVDGTSTLIPGNGAIFDTFGQNKNPNANDYNPNVGKFLYFAPGSPLVGLESYLIAREEFSYSYASTTKPDTSKVGRRIVQPPGITSAPGGSYNYLLTGIRYRRSGAVYRITVTWRKSGPRGWNSLIYPDYSS